MKKIVMLLIVLMMQKLSAQELYIFSEPASNMPAKSLSIKQTAKLLNDQNNIFRQRQLTELMIGLNKNLMLHIGTTFSTMFTDNIKWESVKLYAKYRFFENDKMQAHFRMAAFTEAAYSNNNPVLDEISLDGDQRGVQLGLIATQLIHKLALSSTISIAENYQLSRFNKVIPQPNAYQAISYSLSAGYLLLPKEYINYSQTNINVYVELLGQKSIDQNKYFIDLAPAAQFIFNSAVKVNTVYRFQLNGNMQRMSSNSFLISIEWLFLNVLK